MVKFYKVSEKELLAVRNNIFKENGIPALIANGYVKSPFSGAWYGKNNLGDYTYELCRVVRPSQLEIIVTHISKGDKWIKIYLNIFNLVPAIEFCNQLKDIDGIKFALPPNNLSRTRLRIDDYEGIPLFRSVEHKIGNFYSKNGYETQVSKLTELIKSDMSNIDMFVKGWHRAHKPIVTDWEGNIITKDTSS